MAYVPVLLRGQGESHGSAATVQRLPEVPPGPQEVDGHGPQPVVDLGRVDAGRVVMRPLPPAAGGLAVGRRVLVIDAGEVEERVDGGLERAGVALDLGDEQAALERGQEGDGEVVRVGAVWKVPGVVQTAQPVADGS